jgi:hypothetical protein
VKQPSLHSMRKKNSTGGQVRRTEQARYSKMAGIPLNVDSSPDPTDNPLSDIKRFKKLPKEIGMMLIAAGVVGVILPGPGTPALIAGGLALWPGAFGKLESWLQRRYPGVHQRSMKQIDRFLDDLEKRYPYSPQS